MDASPTFSQRYQKVSRMIQRKMDASVPHPGMRWSVAAILLLLYIGRIAFIGGFYLVSYVVSIRLLFLCVEMITPSVPIDTPLPTAREDDARPFVPKKQEFIVWKHSCITIAAGLAATLFSFLDIPAYWPILVVYVLILIVTTIGGEVRKMMRYGYVPWNTGKKKFVKRAQPEGVSHI